MTMPDPSGNGQPASAPAGLPPVVAPSGRFIVQLFLVPGLIVAGVVAVLLGFSWLSSGNRSPEAFLRDLEGGNRRWYVQFLIAGVGNLMTPVGGPVLADLARAGAGRDPKLNTMVRRQAVWALASLGEALQRSGRLPEGRRVEILAALDAAAETAPGEQSAWARRAAAAVRKQTPLGVVAALVECANADDPFLRQQAALALTFWGGTPAEDRQAEAALLKLARDDGHGTAIKVEKGQ
jgi:hypothetical protein